MKKAHPETPYLFLYAKRSNTRPSATDTYFDVPTAFLHLKMMVESDLASKISRDNNNHTH